MRTSRMGSMVVLAAAAAAMTVGMTIDQGREPERRNPPPRLPRGYASENNRKKSRAADRSKKQFLIKGVRP